MWEILPAGDNHPGQSLIHIYSDTNAWIDYYFQVATSRVHEAKDLLMEAYDAWHQDDRGLTICEAMQDALDDADITYMSFYVHDDDEEEN